MDDDAKQLRDRVDKLEQIAASQQQTIEQLRDQSLLGQWGRRGVLGSIAVALGLASASGSAAAGVGDIGTASERVDVFADTLDADSAVIGGDESDSHWELLDSVTIPSSAESASVGPWTDNYKKYFVQIQTVSQEADTVSMRINGDGNSQTNYNYRQVGGTKKTGASELKLYDTSGFFSEADFDVFVTKNTRSNNCGFGFNPQPASFGQLSVDSMIQMGSQQSGSGFSELKIFGDAGDVSLTDMRIFVWGHGGSQ